MRVPQRKVPDPVRRKQVEQVHDAVQHCARVFRSAVAMVVGFEEVHVLRQGRPAAAILDAASHDGLHGLPQTPPRVLFPETGSTTWAAEDQDILG